MSDQALGEKPFYDKNSKVIVPRLHGGSGFEMWRPKGRSTVSVGYYVQAECWSKSAGGYLRKFQGDKDAVVPRSIGRWHGANRAFSCAMAGCV